MTASPAFEKVLKATGYLSPSGQPVAGLAAAADSPQLWAALDHRRGRLRADAVFSAHEHPISIFKDLGHEEPPDDKLLELHETAWNLGSAPLLWIVTPTAVHLYDCYASPKAPAKGRLPVHSLAKFDLASEERIRSLAAACGRTATETGALWSSSIGKRVNRRNRVDQQLLREIATLDQCLNKLTPPSTPAESLALAQSVAKSFIRRCIFTRCLVDRGLANAETLPPGLGPSPSDMFATRRQALKLFAWLQSTFGGDLFTGIDPKIERELLTAEHLRYMRTFVEGNGLVSSKYGRERLFRFQFDTIPVHLISSIFERFVQPGPPPSAHQQSLRYTPVEMVHWVLDPVFEGLPHGAHVMDPACGAGVFLVDAFRRLVWRATDGSQPTREFVRQVLYGQLHGIDVNASALQVTAFCLYLAALELDEDPIAQIRDLKFEPLIGRTLFKGDALATKLPRQIAARLHKLHFDAVVGNPPGKPGPLDVERAISQSAVSDEEIPYIYPDLKFLQLANELTAGVGRVGMIVKPTPFFSLSSKTVEARNKLIDSHKPCALINLSHLRNVGLFPGSTAPAMLFFSRCKLTPERETCSVGSAPWNLDFVRTGIVRLDPGAIHTVSVTTARSKPWSLKSLTLGTACDHWLLDRWDRDLPTLDEVLDRLGIVRGDRRGRGFSRGTRYRSPQEYFKQLALTPETYTPLRLDVGRLQKFSESTVGRARAPSIFSGPLVLCPGAIKLQDGAKTGRYLVSVYDDDVLYDSSYVGFSFATVGPEVARIMSAVLNSSVTTYQLLMKASCLGIERSIVRYQDLVSLRVPWLHPLAEEGLSQFRDLIESEAHLAEDPSDAKRYRGLDEEVYKVYGLASKDRIVVEEGLDQWQMILGGQKLRSKSIQPPSHDTLCAYARQVVETIDADLRALGKRHLEAAVYPPTPAEGQVSSPVDGLAAIRFAMAAGVPGPTGIVKDGADADLERVARILREETASASLPHLHGCEGLRLYNDDEVFIVKPIETRYWTQAAAINDAEAILGDHWTSENESDRG